MPEKLTRQVGRPTKLSEKTVSLLETCLQSGWSVSQACFAAQISRDTFYKWLKENGEFSDRLREAPEHLLRIAKKNLLMAVVEGDIKASMWVIDKYGDSKFSPMTDEDIPAPGGMTLDEKTLFEMQKILLFKLEDQFMTKKYGRSREEVEPRQEVDFDPVQSHHPHNHDRTKDHEIFSSLNVVAKLLLDE